MENNKKTRGKKKEVEEEKNAFINPKLGEMCVVTAAYEELQSFHEINKNYIKKCNTKYLLHLW